MITRSILFGILFGVTSIRGASQNEEVKFELVEGLNGERLGKITAISQDPTGYMWLSGQDAKCLYRYDGIRLLRYEHDSKNINSLGGTDLETVYADAIGNIWIGFLGDGLDRFNTSTGIFSHFRHDPKDPSSLAGNLVSSLVKDSRGRLWVGTENGLDLFDETKRKFIHYKNSPEDPHSLSCNIVRKIYEDSKGVIWVGTGWPFGGSITSRDRSCGGLNRLETDGTFTQFKHDPNDPQTLINDKVRSIFEDSKGVFWVGTSGDGLHTMDRATGKFNRHQNDPLHPDKLSRPPIVDLVNDHITFIIEDELGFVWIATMLGGINRYNPATKTVTHFRFSNGFPDGSGWNAFVSRDGVLWITTEETNLYRVIISKKTIKDVLLGPRVNDFVDDGKFLWVATSGSGLLQLDEKMKIRKQYVADPGKDMNHFNSILSLHSDSGNTIWLGTYRGVGIFDKQTLNFSDFHFGNEFDDDLGPVNIASGNAGSLWFSSRKWLIQYLPQYDSVRRFLSVEKFLKEKNEAEQWEHDWNVQFTQGDSVFLFSGDSTAFIANSRSLPSVLEDGGGNLWFTVSNNGLYRWNFIANKFAHYLDSVRVTLLYQDSNGVIWAGTEVGLYSFNEGANQFRPLSSPILKGNNKIYGFVEDRKHNLWVTTQSTLIRVDTKEHQVTSFNKLFINPGNVVTNESFTGFNRTLAEFTVPGAVYLKDERIFVGHNKGFYSISTTDLFNETRELKVILTSVLVNSKPMTNSGLVNEIRDLDLGYNQNNLAISFALDDFRAPQANRYFTKLERYDDEWREASEGDAAQYLYVPPGSYKFHVRAYNELGSSAEKVVTIVIHPPWWKTWWAYVTYGLCGLSVLILGRQEIVRRERLRATFILEHLQLEKAKEVDRIKSTFFTNISHEFRTPLALIKGPVQDLMERYTEDSKTLDKLKLIERNSDLLLKLINQILTLSKLESGGQRIEVTEFNLNSFVRAVSGSFSSMTKQKNVGLTIESLSSNFKVLFDKDKLEMILINLINNAIKFTPSGGEVSIGAEMVRENPDAGITSNGAGRYRLIVIVKDNGIGIPQDQQTKIFDRFYQVSDVHKEVGTGLGLALVNELVNLLGGTVEVKSAIGKGSEFKIMLPMKVLQVARKLATDLRPEVIENGRHNTYSGGDQRESTTKPHILIVEDNFDMRKFIVEALGDSYYVLEAEDGKEGLETAVREIPQLIVSDVMMPEIDGVAMTGKLKKDFRTCHIPVILLTAKVTEESMLTGLDVGANDYIAKPFNKRELLLKIRNNIVAGEKMREKIRMELLSETPTFEVQSADEKFLVKVKETIQNRLADEQLGVESLAEDIGLSRVQLYRKITALTGISVNEMIRSFRLQKAAQLLKQDWGSISQITYEVGFSNPSYFSKCFKDRFGVMPSEYSTKKFR